MVAVLIVRLTDLSLMIAEAVGLLDKWEVLWNVPVAASVVPSHAQVAVEPVTPLATSQAVAKVLQPVPVVFDGGVQDLKT